MSAPKWRFALAEPTLGAEEAQVAKEVVENGWLSMGPRTKAFEEAFAAKHGSAHAIAVANGTAALHLSLLALDIGPGVEVIQPSMTFAASANMTIAAGATPVFADIISPQEPTIDPEDVARRITPRTRVVIVMHYGGYPARMAELMALCDEHKLLLVEDACHGPAQRVPELGDRALGTFGALGTFSFFANKNMTTGEGGMILSDDGELAAKLRLLRSHGMTSLSWDRHRGHASSYDVMVHGLNYRIDDLRSAIGLIQLEKLEKANSARRAVAQIYARVFDEAKLPDVAYVFGDRPSDGAAHIAAILVPASKRDDIRKALHDARIQTSLHYPPIHFFSAFADKGNAAGLATAQLPNTEEFASRVITLPIYPGLGTENAVLIADTFIQAFEPEFA
jgi:dTDP-4-amino-4,6-dideoxygalactose transaminase